jgi:hypothetical protein
MSSRKRGSSIKGQWVGITIEMLESPAFRALTLSAHRVIARLQIELARHGGKDNGQLPCTYTDFANYGIDRHSIAPAIREVEALGFAFVTRRGRAGNSEWRTPNWYRLSFRDARGGYGGTDEWRDITEETAKQIQKAARAVPPRKSKSRCGKKTVSSGETPHQRRAAQVVETPTTGHSGETPTTFYISSTKDAAA